MNEKYDLHCHSTASDGALTPTELINRACQQGVSTVSLTDHDTINGQAEAIKAAKACGLHFIPGIEISTTWENKCFHILGLNIDPENPVLIGGIKSLQTLRSERAKKIAQKLAKQGILNAYEAVIELAQGGMVTRAHFAEFLLSDGYVSSQQQAFDRYLGKGHPAFVATTWADLEQAVNWITEAGGIAVVAHPMRYTMTASWMRRFLTFFKAVGGQGIEVITGRCNEDEIRRVVHYAQQFDLSASVGSDFHTPKNQWIELGRLYPLPNNVTPVWELFH